MTLNFEGVQILRIHLIKEDFITFAPQIGKLIDDSLTKKWEKRKSSLSYKKAAKLLDGSIDDNEKCSCIIWQPNNNNAYSVFITNMSDGWPTLLNCYQEIYKSEILFITMTIKSVDFEPMNCFEYFKGRRHRLIQVSRDNRWQFIEEGKALGFENEEYYKRKKIANRLDKEIIIEYLKSNGIEIDNAIFWSSDNALEFHTQFG